MSVPVYVHNKKQPIHAIGVNKFISREILIELARPVSQGNSQKKKKLKKFPIYIASCS